MQPLLYTKNAFDATKLENFSFNWGGSQSKKNRLLLRDNITDSIVYDQIQETFQLNHALPAQTLSNGHTYNAIIYSIGIDDIESLPSNKIIFKCFSKPIFKFSNLVNNQVIKNSSYQAQLTYSQIEGELLDSYQIEIYNNSKSLIRKSGILYNFESLSYSIPNLEDNSQYYIRAIGNTVNGMVLDTGYISVSVEYVSPTVFSLVTLENLPNKGQIKISYNAQLVTGTCNETPRYLGNEKIDLTKNGIYTSWDNGFEIQSDGIIQIIGQSFKDYSIISEWDNGINKIEIKYMRGGFASQSEEKAYFILRAYNQITSYIIYSNYIPIPSVNDRIHVWIKRVGNVYSIQCEVLN